tara:strand:+ start:2188 stop:2406 length:219 start_codon:yes stop_codon:yes gene_type:complete
MNQTKSYRVDLPQGLMDRLDAASKRRGGVFGMKAFLFRQAVEILLTYLEGKEDLAISKLDQLSETQVGITTE